MNTKIGQEEAYSSVAGKYILHKESNSNGELTCEYAAANNMYIISTKFNHKKYIKEHGFHQMETRATRQIMY